MRHGAGVEGLDPGRNNPPRSTEYVIPLSQRGMEGDLPAVERLALEKSPLAPFTKGGRQLHRSMQPEGASP